MRPDEIERLLREDTPQGEAHDGDAFADARLRDALARMDPGPVEVPEEFDEAVLALGRVRLRRRRLVPALAVAAGVLLALAATLLFREEAAPAARPPDIVDAYRLALRLDRGEAPDARWDVTGDGRVDGADVDALTARAVRLPQEENAG